MAKGRRAYNKDGLFNELQVEKVRRQAHPLRQSIRESVAVDKFGAACPDWQAMSRGMCGGVPVYVSPA
jgi:hypothetical protein